MSDFNNVHRVPRIEPYVPDRTELLGTTSGDYNDQDIGKAVKVSGNACVACAAGDAIEGFVTSVNVGTKGGYSVGGVKRDINTEFTVRDEDGGLAIGDYVVAGTPTALGTALPSSGENVIKAVDGMVTASATLAIKAGGSALAKSSNAFNATFDGVLVTKAAGDMAALSGTVTNAKFNVFAFCMIADGTVSTVMGTEGDTLAEVVFPATPAGAVQIGYVIINPTGTGDFVGGTTALDDGTVVPNAVYVNTPYVNSLPASNRWRVMALYTTPSVAGSRLMVQKVA